MGRSNINIARGLGALLTICSATGPIKESFAPKACALAKEITKIPYSSGNILLRLENGQLYPYSTKTIRKTGATALYGPLGTLKSVVMGQIVRSVIYDSAEHGCCQKSLSWILPNHQAALFLF